MIIIGYRSNFKLSVSKKGKDLIEEKISKWIANEELENEDVMPYRWEYKDDKENRYVLSGEYLKMYKEFEEVQKLYDCMSEMEQEDISYHFIRLGESFDDVEEILKYGKDEIMDLDLIREISY